jgi:hypothetical protein
MKDLNLEDQLLKDAELAVPPFGAESVKLARQLGAQATGILVGHVRARGNTALLALEVLREADRKAYDSIPAAERIEVYAHSLENSDFFNTWGLPGYQLTATSRALIALGDEAVSRLRTLLEDQRSAPLSGSQDATTSKMYANRVCDYAWVFIAEIKQEHYEYFQSPNKRDVAIKALRRQLNEPMKSR